MAVPSTGYRLYASDPSSFVAKIESSVSTPVAVLSVPGVKLWVHSSSGGPRLLTLYSMAGDPVSVLTSDSQGFIPFYAPDNYGTLWVQPLTSGGAGSGAFTPVFPADLADVLRQQAATFAEQSLKLTQFGETLAAFGSSPGTGTSTGPKTIDGGTP